jgi:putative transposase
VIRGVYGSNRVVGDLREAGATNRLNREFTVDAPDQAWVTDITYIRTWQSWLYLAVAVERFAQGCWPVDQAGHVA